MQEIINTLENKKRLYKINVLVLIIENVQKSLINNGLQATKNAVLFQANSLNSVLEADLYYLFNDIKKLF